MFEDKMELIKEYITEDECSHMCHGKLFGCEECINFEDCYVEAEIRCADDFNNGFARAVDYGGCSNEEEFWEQILD